MAEEVGKREKHAFLSHAHVDKTQADMLYDFLTRVAGIRSGTTQTTCRLAPLSLAGYLRASRTAAPRSSCSLMNR
jgi:hypothetical protein